MGIGISVFLAAVGAVLVFAVNAAVPNVSLVTAGVILMIAGAIGLLMSLTIWGPRRRAVDPYVAGGVDRTVVRDRTATPTGERTVVRRQRPATDTRRGRACPLAGGPSAVLGRRDVESMRTTLLGGRYRRV